MKKGQFEKARKISEKMTAYKNENFDEITKPRLFFCTWHNEAAYLKSVGFDFEFLGSK